MAKQRKRTEIDCRPCEELAHCPFPPLVDYLKNLARQGFHGRVNLVIAEGVIRQVKQEEDVEFIRS